MSIFDNEEGEEGVGGGGLFFMSRKRERVAEQNIVFRPFIFRLKQGMSDNFFLEFPNPEVRRWFLDCLSVCF